MLGATSLLLLAPPAYSQSLGEVARQERERKQDQATHSKHVYDNEDLKRAQILVPEDWERVQARKQKAEPTPAKPAVEIAGGDIELSSLPLSNIARRYGVIVVAAAPIAEPVVPAVDAPVVTPVVTKHLREPEPPSNPSPLIVTARPRVYPASSEPPAHFSTAPTSPAPVSIRNPQVADTGKVIRKETAEGSRVQVQRGDTLWKLAKEYLGRGEDWPLLAANNPQVTEPARLAVGTWVVVPEKAADKQSTRQSSRSVRVERGDSLWKLTEAQFGDGRAWGCIAQANPQLQNANLILPGETLTIPDTCATSPVLQGRYPANFSESMPTRSAQLEQQGR
jgi:nucleoid-associated protein YgaU